MARHILRMAWRVGGAASRTVIPPTRPGVHEPRRPGKAPGVDDADAFVLADRQEVRIARHKERGAAGDGRGEVLVVIRARAHTRHLNGPGDEFRQDDEFLKPERGIEVSAPVPPSLTIRRNWRSAGTRKP